MRVCKIGPLLRRQEVAEMHAHASVNILNLLLIQTTAEIITEWLEENNYPVSLYYAFSSTLGLI